METRPAQKDMIFLREGCSNSAKLMSARLAFSRKRHMPLVRLPVERTKMVTMSAPLNKYGLEIFLSLIFWKFKSGLRALRSWTSVESSSVSTEHKATPNNSSGFGIAESECDLWCMSGSFGGSNDESLFWDLEQENSLGGERERETGELGKRGFTVIFLEGVFSRGLKLFGGSFFFFRWGALWGCPLWRRRVC